MHIGFEDPWSYYRRHRMGQFPHLLALPRFGASVGEEPGEYKDSTRFAEATRREFQLLTEKHTVVTKEGWVAVIQPRGHPEGLGEVREDLSKIGMKPAQWAPLLDEFDDPALPPYRLLVIDPSGKPELVYAQKIDICTGSGTPRLLDAGTMSPELYAAYRGKPWIPLERRTEFRHVLCSHDALYRTSLWPERPRVCVHGTGGVALNVVETALEAQKWVDWTATETHDKVFAQPGRNRELLREGSAAGAWTPSSTRLRLGESVEVQTLAVEALEAVEVAFQRAPKAVMPSQMTDHRSPQVSLEDGNFPFSSASEKAGFPGSGYAQLIVAKGFAADGKLPGTAAFLIRLVDKAEGLSAIVSTDGRWIGLRSGPEKGNGPVRILGIAATSFPPDALVALSSNFKNQRTLAIEYLRTLPLQTQPAALAGITYNAVSIMLANQFTASTINANTASGTELASILGDTLGKRVLEAREKSPHGFRTLDELLAALTTSKGNPPLSKLLDLSFDYQ
jgi:hypothetical protein